MGVVSTGSTSKDKVQVRPPELPRPMGAHHTQSQEFLISFHGSGHGGGSDWGHDQWNN